MLQLMTASIFRLNEVYMFTDFVVCVYGSHSIGRHVLCLSQHSHRSNFLFEGQFGPIWMQSYQVSCNFYTNQTKYSCLGLAENPTISPPLLPLTSKSFAPPYELRHAGIIVILFLVPMSDVIHYNTVKLTGQVNPCHAYQ